MADAKLTALSAIGTLGNDDLFYVVDDPGGSPLSRKATGTVVKAYMLDGARTATYEDATTNTTINQFILQRTSSAAPADGIGTAIAFDIETAAANVERGARIRAYARDTTSTAEDFDIVFETMAAGATAAERFRVTEDDAGGFPLSFRTTGLGHFQHITGAGAGFWLDTPTTAYRIFFGHDASVEDFFRIYSVSATDNIVGVDLANKTMQLSRTSLHVGSVGYTDAADRQLQVTNETATTNAVTYVQRLTSISSGTPANNIGVGVEYEVETAAANNEVGATLEVFAHDTTAASEDFTLRIKTMTGGSAAATSLDVSLPGTVYPQGHLFGLTMTNDAGDTTNDIAIAAGEAVDETGVWNMTLAASIIKRIDATWVVGTNQGGMANNGTGVADTTWYEVLLIGRADTRVVDVAFSTTANRAVLPTSYTHKRRIGWVRRGASTNLQFTQVDDYVTLTTQINDASTSITATAAALTLTVPPSSIARFRASLLLTAQTIANETVTVFSEIVEGNVTPAGSTGIASLGAGAQNATSANNDFTSAGHFELRVSSTSTIEHDSVVGAGAAGTHDVSTFGWIDHRRRMSAT